MSFCKYCGAALDEDSRFCAACGSQIAAPSATAAPAPRFNEPEQTPPDAPTQIPPAQQFYAPSAPAAPAQPYASPSAPAAPTPQYAAPTYAAPAAPARNKRGKAPVIILSVLLALSLFAVGFLVYKQYFSEPKETAEENDGKNESGKETGEEKEDGKEAAKEPAAVTEADLNFTVNGVTYQYPFPLSAFTAERGWTLRYETYKEGEGDTEYAEEPTLAPEMAGTVYCRCVSGGSGVPMFVRIHYYNDTNADRRMTECPMGQFMISCLDANDDWAPMKDIVFARGYKPPYTESSLVALFGEPDAIAYVDDRTLIYNNTESKQDIGFMFANSTGQLFAVIIMDMDETSRATGREP